MKIRNLYFESESSKKEDLKTEFKNELGNSITIEISSKKMDDAAGVEISISCPESTSTNHITLEECKRLYQLLGKYLN